MKQDKKILIKLGCNIRKARKEKNLSQEKLAFKANIDRTYIGGVERGERNISIMNLCRIAYALSIPPFKLLEDIEYIPSQEHQIS